MTVFLWICILFLAVISAITLKFIEHLNKELKEVKKRLRME